MRRLRAAAKRILATLPAARLACLNVLKLGRLTIDRTLDEEGHNKHVDRLVALKHWASPLKLDENRLTVHVLEAVDPASAILEFADVNQVDHIIIGARENSHAALAARQRLVQGCLRSAAAPSPWCGRRALAAALRQPDDRDMPPMFSAARPLRRAPARRRRGSPRCFSCRRPSCRP